MAGAAQKFEQRDNVAFFKTMRPNVSKPLPWIIFPRDPETLAYIADRINVVLYVKDQLGCNDAEKRFWETLQAHVNALDSYAAAAKP